MPDYLRGQARDTAVAVKAVSPTINTFYAFKRKNFESIAGVSTADLTPLGQVELNAVPEGGLIFFRASAPKPPRCRKTINRNPTVNQQGSISTFYSIGQEKDIISAGWDLSTPAKAVNLQNSERSITAIAELANGAFYCFSMNKKDFDSYGAALGLKSPTSITTDLERASLVMGSSRPQPAKAAIKLTSSSTFSSFVSHSAISGLAEQGFFQIKGAINV